jgi:hypothetical protein
VEGKRPTLKLGVNEGFQFRAHSRRNLHLVTTEPPGDGDGLPVGAQELNAGGTIAKMVVEPAFRLWLEGTLDIFKQQTFDIAASSYRSKELLERVHFKVRCRDIEERFAWSKYLE